MICYKLYQFFCKKGTVFNAFFNFFFHKIDHDNILKPAGDLLITGNAISCYRKNGNKKWINLFCENLIHFYRI